MIISIAVFAYNEQRNVRRALDSVFAAAPSDAEIRVFVLVNGCTDRTAEVVRDYAQKRPEVVPVEIPLGDKCNAWNLYVHELADVSADAHFFMDGDCWCSPVSLATMAEALLSDPKATAIAGLPLSGRHGATLQRYVKEWHWLFGMLYGVKWSRIEWIREQGIRLPIGLCGNDHVITRLLWLDETDLDLQDQDRVIYRDGVGGYYDSLKPYLWRDCRTYYKRQATYCLRQMQIRRLGENPVLKLRPTMDEINREILDELNGKRIWHPIERAVRRKLRRMYPGSESTYHQDRLAAAGPPVFPMNLIPERVQAR